MKAITVKQPWATMIARGLKTIETRTHSRFANLKGDRIAIHAGRSWDVNWDLKSCGLDGTWMRRLRDRECHTFGAVIATAEVAKAEWIPGRGETDDMLARCPTYKMFGLYLTRVVSIPDVACRGNVGAWSLPKEVDQIVHLYTSARLSALDGWRNDNA